MCTLKHAYIVQKKCNINIDTQWQSYEAASSVSRVLICSFFVNETSWNSCCNLFRVELVKSDSFYI